MTPSVMLDRTLHRLVDVAVSYQVSDNRDPARTCGLSVGSNEPIDATGDADTGPDWNVIDARRPQLRAERAGPRNGRVYTITLTCRDASANPASQMLTVHVPKSQ